MKKCYHCKKTKPLGDYYKNKTRSDGLQSHCKVCHKIRKKSHYENNKDLYYENNVTWVANNPDKVKAKAKRHRQSPDGYAYYNSRNALQRSIKQNATPDWVDKEDLKGMYTLAKRLENLCGVSYHVDHIVPLNGENICGLHVPWNLQILEAKMNLSKGNSYASW